MHLGKLSFAILLAIAAVPIAAAQDGALDKLLGTFTQNQPCKGDSSDAKKLVKIGKDEVQSNFGPCKFTDRQADGAVVKAHATCKNKAGVDFDVSLSFTLRDDNSIEFIEEDSQYKSVLYRCPAGTK